MCVVAVVGEMMLFREIVVFLSLLVLVMCWCLDSHGMLLVCVGTVMWFRYVLLLLLLLVP